MADTLLPENMSEDFLTTLFNQDPENLKASMEAYKLRLIQEQLANPLSTYVPNSKIEQFVVAVGNGTHKVYLLSAANGVGKSAAAVVTLGNMIFGPQNEWFEHKFFKDFPYPKNFWYVSEQSNLKDNIVGTQMGDRNTHIQKYFPEGRYSLNKSGYDYFSEFQSDTGWKGTFKCLRPDQRILMADGREVPVKDVKIGDMVKCSKGNTRVVGTYQTEVPEFYKIKTNHGSEIVCSSWHPILTTKGWKKASEVRFDDDVVEPKIEIEPTDNGREDWQYFVLGALIGDGHLRTRELLLECHSPMLVEYIRSILPEGYLLVRRGNKNRGLTSWRVAYKLKKNKNPMTRWVKALGLMGKYSHEKYVPDEIFTATKSQIGFFLSGLYSTDGTFSGNEVGYSSRSERLAQDVKKLLRRFDVRATTVASTSETHFGEKKYVGTQYITRFGSRDDVMAFAKYVRFIGKKNDWAEFVARASRKKSLKECAPIHPDNRHRITSIEIMRGGATCDIEVEHECHDYIVDGLIVHNTFDMDKKKFEGPTIGLIVLDEPPPEYIFDACIARTRQGGFIIMPMTPLAESAWIFDRLVEKVDDSIGNIFMMYADIEDACIEHGIRGHLHHTHITDMLNLWNDEEVEARAHGKPTHLKGRVYKALHKDKHCHVMLPQEFTQDEYQIFNVVDPHDARPPFINWFAVDKFDRAFVIGEFPSMPEYKAFEDIGPSWNLTTGDVCERIKSFEKENDWDPKKIIRVMDPNFGMRKEHDTGKRTFQIWQRHGVRLGWSLRYRTDVLDALEPGHDLVREFIKPDADGNVRLYVNLETCPNTWRHLNRYQYAWREGKAVEKHGLGEKVGQKYKDGADPLRYFMMFFKGPRMKKNDSTEELPEHYGLYGMQQGVQGSDWRDPYSI